jgi:hypothetical protein
LAPTIPSVEPETFRAGETVSWTKIVADYPNTDGYSLVYSFDGPSNLGPVTATNVADGSYSASISAATTGSLDAGTYRWAAHAETGSGASIERYPVASGIFVVKARLLGDVVESHAVKTLRVIEAALEGRLTADMEAYTIGNRQITKIPIKELYSMRAMYRNEVLLEKNPRRFVVTRRVAFVDP